MECEIFAVLPKDVTVNGYTVEHKDIKVDFSGLFQTGQNDIFTSYITERCLSHVLVGRNVAHFLVDSSVDQFVALCRDVVSVSLEESSKCRVSGYYVHNSSDARCLLSSSSSVQYVAGWGSSPLGKLQVEEIKSVDAFENRVMSKVLDNVPSPYEVICLTFGFEIIPASGTNIAKLFPELSVIMIQTDGMYIPKIISDIANISDPFSESIVSTALSANSVGFYLSGNFQCSATFNLRWGAYKTQLSMATHMKLIKSFPMINDVYSKGFLAKISSSQKFDEPIDTSVVKTLKNDLQTMAKDNVRLMSENEELHRQLDKVRIDMNNLLSSKQILSEEVRQKLSDEQEIYDKLTEMAVEKVKIKDMSEVKRYELMNKIFSLENDLLNAQIVSEEWKTKYEEVSNSKSDLESLKNDLQAEYITLKNNHHSAAGKQTTLERRCEHLSMELIQLQMDYEEMSKMRTKSSFLSLGSSLPDIKRTPTAETVVESRLKPSSTSLKSIVSNTGVVEELRHALEAQKQAGNAERNRLLQEIMSLKGQLGEAGEASDRKARQKELLQHTLTLKNANETHKRKINTLEDKLYESVQSKEGIYEEFNRLKINHNAISILKSKLESENVALRLKQRNAIEDFRVRLDCYIKDTEKFLNRKNPEALLQPHLSKMVEDYKKSHVEREAALLEELNVAKADLLDTLEKYHKLEHEYSQVSNAKVVQNELSRLRKEIKANEMAVQQGKLLAIEKVEELLTKQQHKYQSTIEKLRIRATKAETQLNRFVQHFNT